jgi:MazG family protein
MPDAPDATDPSSPGAQLDRLVTIMQILRSPDGCPWDREQTLKSLRPFLVEETYEVIDAIDTGDTNALRDELGDFVFEAVFLAQLCTEDGQFTLANALSSAADKLVRRHPHVFDVEVDRNTNREIRSSVDVKQRWEEIKAKEQQTAGQEPSLFGGLPRGLPALLRAYRMGRRAATLGFDWDQPSEALEKVSEELGELRAAISEEHRETIEEKLGDLLFAVTNVSHHLGIEPEGALQATNQKFATRFASLERRFASQGRTLRDATLDEIESEWRHLRSSPSHPTS